MGRVRVRRLTPEKTHALVPQNLRIRMLELKKQCDDLLKIRVWFPDSSEGSDCEDQRCKSPPDGVTRIIKPLGDPSTLNSGQPESPLPCSHLCRLAVPYSDRLLTMTISCLGYYCNESGLGLSTVVFYKTLRTSRRVEKKKSKNLGADLHKTGVDRWR